MGDDNIRHGNPLRSDGTSPHSPERLEELGKFGWYPEMRPGRGCYVGKCSDCGNSWYGVKACRRCENCAIELADAPKDDVLSALTSTRAKAAQHALREAMDKVVEASMHFDSIDFVIPDQEGLQLVIENMLDSATKTMRAAVSQFERLV